MERRIDIFFTEGISIKYSIIGKGGPIFVMHGGIQIVIKNLGIEA